MIARLIDLCVHNRFPVLLLTGILVAAGVVAIDRITIDAIPDLSDVQVVIRTDYPGRAPQIVEDQVTYPLTTSMLAVPEAETVRGFSMFGSSFVYVIFEDGTDLYWARSRVLEQLASMRGQLPEGVTPQLGPDATGVGWVFQYVLTTGPYSPDHPDGLWHDPRADRWYPDPETAPDAARERLTHHRVFPNRETCPLTGRPLAEPDTDLADLRSLQDWYLRFELTAVDGVSEVAPVGGFVKQYQVVIDPVELQAYGISLPQVKRAIQRSNVDVGGRVIEQSETEYMVRGLGYLGTPTPEEIAEAEAAGVPLHELRERKVLEQLEQIGLAATETGSPIYLADVADVRVGPDIRRGIAEWNGQGEVVGGIVVMRFGENARAVIDRVREKLDQLEQGLPPGVAVRVAYDRSDLIDRAVHTVSETLVEEIIVVSLVMLLFLLHARSAFVAAFVLPTGVLATLLAMWAVGINANIMSLGGIAISIGVMVDSSIVMVENAHKHLERLNARGRKPPGFSERVQAIAEAAKEVGPTLFFSLLIITVSFLPIFVLSGQSGRLFKPLAYTKTFAMAAAAGLAVTVIPVLMVYFIRQRVLRKPDRWPRWGLWVVYAAIIVVPAAVVAMAPLDNLAGYRWWMVAAWPVLAAIVVLPQRIMPEARNPISRLLQRVNEPAFAFVMRFKLPVLLVAAAVLAVTIVPFQRLGEEFMPPLEEGDLLYMPTTDPGLSVTKARELLQQTDKLIAQFPEVDTVFGKIGRAETATDPAPLTMLETTITLHRDPGKWRRVPVHGLFRGWPDWLAWGPRQVWPDTRRITTDELVYGYTIPADLAGTEADIAVPGLNAAVQIPGLANAWTMPIKTRIDMLSTGIKTPVGIKVMGEDLATLADLTDRISTALKTDPSTAGFTASAFADKAVGGKYLDITPNRQAIARYAGLSVGDVQDVIMSAIGGMNVDETVEGLRRYPISVRYPRELRDSLPALKQTLVSTQAGEHVPLGQLADFRIVTGPPVIKSENARRTAWVFVDIQDLDVGTYVERAKAVVEQRVELPPGYSLAWSGQYEYMQQARQRLMIVVPVAAVLILLLLYAATRSWLRVGIVLLAVPFSLVGAVWLVWLLDYELSLAVWVGVIALAGLDAETGLVMLLYLDNSYDRFKAEGRMRNRHDLYAAIHEGAVQRIRPKTMTVVTTFMALIPLMWASGAGADTMRRLAAPMIGGLATSFLLELLLYPVIFYYAKRVAMWREARREEPTADAATAAAGGGTG